MMSPPRLGRDNLSGKRTYTECSSRSGSGGPLRRGRVAAQCRLSAPNAEGKQKRHCAIKLNANGRLDNLLSAICRSSPLEAGGGTTSARAGEGKKAAPGGAAGLAQNFFQLVQIPGIGADLAALPAGYHGLVNVHRIRKLGLSQAFGLSGGGNIKLDRRKGALAFTGKIA